MRELTVFFGPPGTGKTEQLTKLVSQEADQYQTPPSRIAFLSFSRRAILEARHRNALPADDGTGWWRTTHSMAYRLLELKHEQVVTPERLQEFAQLVGESSADRPSPGRRPWETSNRLSSVLQLLQTARARQSSLEAEWCRWGGAGLEYRFVERYARQYAAWKATQGLYDFDDMIEHARGELPVDAVIVDEAQDTSPAAWAMLRRVTPREARVYVAGDDDQTIYNWAGADAGQMLRWKARRSVLAHSWRLTRRIKALADALAARIGLRYPKSYTARDDDGSISTINDPAQLIIPASGSVLLLARSRRLAGRFRDLCRQQGVVYSYLNGPWSWEDRAVRAARVYETLRRGTAIPRSDYRVLRLFLTDAPGVAELGEYVGWADVFAGERWAGLETTPWYEALALAPEDRAYIRALRRRGESLTTPGRVRILTIHQAKGAEADHVILDSELPGPARDALRGGVELSDAERRVWYVAVTRARQTLMVLRSGRYGMELPALDPL